MKALMGVMCAAVALTALSTIGVAQAPDPASGKPGRAGAGMARAVMPVLAHPRRRPIRPGARGGRSRCPPVRASGAAGRRRRNRDVGRCDEGTVLGNQCGRSSIRIYAHDGFVVLFSNDNGAVNIRRHAERCDPADRVR